MCNISRVCMHGELPADRVHARDFQGEAQVSPTQYDVARILLGFVPGSYTKRRVAAATGDYSDSLLLWDCRGCCKPEFRGTGDGMKEKARPGSHGHGGSNIVEPRSPSAISTDTINIESLGFRPLSETGSFDLREFRVSSVGRLLDALPISAVLVDSSHVVIYANELFRNLAPAGEHVLGKGFASLFPRPADAARFRDILEKVFAWRKFQVGEGGFEFGSSRIWARMNFRSIRISRATYVLVLIEDVTLENKQTLLVRRHKEVVQRARDQFEKELQERTTQLSAAREKLAQEIENRARLERALANSLKSLSSLLEKTEDGIIVAELGGKILYANRAAESFLGIAQQELVGGSAPFPLTPDKISEVEIKRCTGESGTAELSVDRIHWSGRTALMARLRDVTERKRNEHALLRSQKAESLELIAGGLAHDFNNLLTANMANISLAKMRATPESPAHEPLLKAERAASRAKDLAQLLLKFTKGGALVKRPFYLPPLIREASSLALSGSNVKCQLDLHEGIWLIEGDPAQIGMVFQNLLINAQQAMPEGGTVRISGENVVVGADWQDQSVSEHPGKYVRVSLQDTGKGIATENLGRIFDPYFTTKTKGSGLGLATAYSIVKRHQGRIEVESREGVGTTFWIYLPASGQETEDGPSPLDQGPVSGEGRILIMDDEPDILEAAADLLTILGYEVDCVSDGGHAIQAYRQGIDEGRQYQAVIMDLTVPGGMGGKIAVQKLLEIDPSARVILSSGYSDDPIMSSYEKYGFKGAVAKPYNASEISRILHEVLIARESEPGETTAESPT